MSDIAPPTSEFLFRGSRDYLHSSTMFDDLIATDPQPANIDFAVHRMTGRQVSIVPETLDGPDQVLIARYRSSGLTRCLYETSQPIQGSYPCNEKEICKHSTFDGSMGSFDMPPVNGATFIEAVVGVYKHLLQLLYADEKRKLVFARMTVEHVPSDGPCSVAHRRRIGDDYFESRLSHDQTPLGKLIFGLI